MGNLRQVTASKLVLTCHDSIAVVQPPPVGMAVPDETILRRRVCRGCGAVFRICRRCDRGHRYCSPACRRQARRRQRRCANQRYQQSPEGRLDHCDRQREYRRRARTRVTDQASPSIFSPAPCGYDNPGSTRRVTQTSSAAAIRQCWPSSRPVAGFCCIICGRSGRFVHCFPPISRSG